MRVLRAAAACATATSVQGLSVTNINGHRAVLLGPRSTRSENANRPPLVLLGGTAQWIDSWTGHLSALSTKRQVLIYETRGQGGAFADGSLSLEDAGLPQHAKDFREVVREARLTESGPCDVVAFSFGARVAMCAIATAPPSESPLVRRLCVTGVTADRGERGRLALRSWRAALRTGDHTEALEAFVWRLILDTYAAQTLEKAKEAQVSAWVKAVTAANDVRGLRAIVEQTHVEDPSDPTHPLAMALAIKESGAVEAGLLINGQDDLLCGEGAGQALADAAGWRYATLAKAAHACPLEQPMAWRRLVTGFLDA